MHSHTIIFAAGLALAGHAAAQPFTMTRSTPGPGGATAPSTGGAYGVAGTLGQPVAGKVAGGPYECSAGFWPGGEIGPPPCYANCDGSTIEPILNVNDFVCFLTRYAAGNPSANCDGSTVPPTLNVNDFICFQTRYAAGCP